MKPPRILDLVSHGASCFYGWQCFKMIGKQYQYEQRFKHGHRGRIGAGHLGADGLEFLRSWHRRTPVVNRGPPTCSHVPLLRKADSSFGRNCF